MIHKYHNKTKRNKLHRLQHGEMIPAMYLMPKKYKGEELTVHIGAELEIDGIFVSLCNSAWSYNYDRWKVVTNSAHDFQKHSRITCQRCLRILENMQKDDKDWSMHKAIDEELTRLAQGAFRLYQLKTN